VVNGVGTGVVNGVGTGVVNGVGTGVVNGVGTGVVWGAGSLEEVNALVVGTALDCSRGVGTDVSTVRQGSRENIPTLLTLQKLHGRNGTSTHPTLLIPEKQTAPPVMSAATVGIRTTDRL
jgi:hypothetical protein